MTQQQIAELVERRRHMRISADDIAYMGASLELANDRTWDEIVAADSTTIAIETNLAGVHHVEIL